VPTIVATATIYGASVCSGLTERISPPTSRFTVNPGWFGSSTASVYCSRYSVYMPSCSISKTTSYSPHVRKEGQMRTGPKVPLTSVCTVFMPSLETSAGIAMSNVHCRSGTAIARDISGNRHVQRPLQVWHDIDIDVHVRGKPRANCIHRLLNPIHVF